MLARAIGPGISTAFGNPGGGPFDIHGQAAGVAFSLGHLARHVHIQALGLYRCHGREARKQHVVGTLAALGGPLGNGEVAVALGARALGVGQAGAVGLPASVAQHLVNEQAGGGFVHGHLLRGLG